MTTPAQTPAGSPAVPEPGSAHEPRPPVTDGAAADVRSHRPPGRGKRILTLAVIAAILVWAFGGVGLRGLGKTWRQVLGAMWQGVLHPDWAYVYDGSGEDLVSLLIETVAIAFFGTVISVAGGVVLAFLAASRAGRRRTPTSAVTSLLLAVIRTFPEIVLAVIFVKMVGPGAFAGALAIGFHSVGMLGRLYAEEIEKLTPGPDEAIVAVGGSRMMVLLWSQLPRLIPQFLSLALNRFEISVRAATILGFVGAGGIGTPIIFAVSARAWDRVAIIILGTIVTVTIIDTISGALRKKLR